MNSGCAYVEVVASPLIKRTIVHECVGRPCPSSTRMHSQEDRSGKYEDMFHGESGEEKMMDPMLQLPILLKIMLNLLVAVSDLFLPL